MIWVGAHFFCDSHSLIYGRRKSTVPMSVTVRYSNIICRKGTQEIYRINKSKHCNYIIGVKRVSWRERDAASIQGNSLSTSYCKLEDYPRSHHYMLPVCFIQPSQDTCCQRIEMHHCLYMLHLFFIVTDLASQIWILSPQ